MNRKETQKNKFTPALGYGFLSGIYDLAIKYTMPEKKFRNKLIDLVYPQNNEYILEFGFGTGQNIILACQRNRKAKISGVDIDPKIRQIALEKIKKTNIDATLDLYDGSVLPYADTSFNKVFSSLVFHQLNRETKIKCLKEIYRILKPSGQLIIGDWGKSSTKLMRLAFIPVQVIDGFKTTTDNVKGKLPDFIEECGFKNVQAAGFIDTLTGTYSYYTATK